MRIPFCAFIAALVVGATGTARSPPQNVNVSQRPGNDAEQSIAVNPTNPKNVVVVWDRGRVLAHPPDPGMFVGVSFDGGVTWRWRVIGRNDALGDACCDPSIAFDSFGNLFLTYIFKREHTLPIALSTDGGHSFHLIANLRGMGSVDQPTVTAGESAVWVAVGADDAIRAFRATAAGLGVVGRFSRSPVPGTHDCGYGDIAIGPGGEVAQTCVAKGGRDAGKIYVSVDPDGLGPNPFGRLVLAADSRITAYRFIPAQPERAIDAEPGLAWDRTGAGHHGRLYLVYSAELRRASDDLDVFLRYSDDNGTSWSQPTRVNDDRTSRSQFLPKVALDPTTGLLAVVWYDARNDAGTRKPGDTNGIPNDDAQLWGTFTRDGHAYSRNFRISAGTSNAHVSGNRIDYGDYTGLAYYGGVARPAWADNSNSTRDNPGGRLHGLDIYTAAVSPP